MTEWGYHGEIGPERWGDLCPGFAMAKQGKQQSPIDISGVREASEAAIAIHYKPVPLDIVNNGHSIQQDCPDGGRIKAGGKEYQLLQFHFHSPSEHTIDGERCDMEVHLVHQSANGELAVLGIILKAGAENTFLAGILPRFPGTTGDRVQDPAQLVDATDMLPVGNACYAYDGSLTTPPCTEGVKWFIFTAILELSPLQLAEFQELYNGNYRPVQPLNGRIVRST